MTLECPQHLTCGGIPNLRCAIIGAGHDPGTLRRELRGRHRVPMAGQRDAGCSSLRRSVRLPDLRHVMNPSGDHLPVIGAEGHIDLGLFPKACELLSQLPRVSPPKHQAPVPRGGGHRGHVMGHGAVQDRCVVGGEALQDTARLHAPK